MLYYVLGILALAVGVAGGYFFRKKQVEEKNKDLHENIPEQP